MNTKNDIRQMMEDVRKAHRLIYQFQDRMFQLMKRIANDYGLKQPVGRKHFSNPIKKKLTSNDYPEANLNIQDKWTWDMLYTYEFEYYFGKVSKHGLNGCLSVFQISDNGYYLADGYQLDAGAEQHLSKRSVNDFWPTNQSSSYLIFAFECFPKNEHRRFMKHPQESSISLYGGERDELVKEENVHTFVAKRYLIEDFFSRESVSQLLEEFSDLVFSKTAYRLMEKQSQCLQQETNCEA